MKVKKLMKEYFENDKSKNILSSIFSLPHRIELPIQTVEHIESQWTIVESPRRLHRKFTFTDVVSRNHFVEELMFYEQKTTHFGSINIQGLDIIMEVYTHDLDDITELDKDYAAYADETFLEIRHMSNK